MTFAARQLPYQVVHYLAGTYDVASDATGKYIGTVPANSLIVSWHVNIVDDFDDAALVTVGDNDDNDSIAADADIDPDVDGSKAAVIAVRSGSTDLDVRVFVTEAPTTGQLEVAVGFIPATDVFPVA